jgi:hypothetical protein
MKRAKRVLALVLMLLGAGRAVGAEEGMRTALVRVLYVGNKESARGRAFARFLDDRFILIDSVDREGFDPASAQGAEVVLLDWSERDLAAGPAGGASLSERDVRSPLGERSTWTKPTVLLGSAGHLLAVSWKVFGGAGRACLEPYAFDLPDHPVFARPIPLDRSRLIRRPWPGYWRDGDESDDVRLLALVPADKKPHALGWCTESLGMNEAPEVEILCGGLNAASSAAAAVWRQGNLLHFGFDLAPDEMNPAGKALLVNAIAYIARFGDDRPIMETPCYVGGSVVLTRAAMVRTIASNSRAEWNELKARLDPALLQAGGVRDLRTFARWYPSVKDYFCPSEDGRITIDADAQALGLRPNRREFFKRAIARLARPGDDARRVRRLLARYAPDGPGEEASARAWSAWFKENGDALFFADVGGYRWYIDPLAKARGESTESLRGPARGGIRQGPKP